MKVLFKTAYIVLTCFVFQFCKYHYETLPISDVNPKTTIVNKSLRGIGIEQVNLDGLKVKGENWLLAIGIDNYLEWPKLKTAVSDASAFRDILIDKYSFTKKRTILIKDFKATRYNILNTFADFAKRISSKDILIIYYAGHGHIDQITKVGSWIPVDAKLNDYSARISNNEIKSYFNVDAIKAKHILLISDSCFAGDFFRGKSGGYEEVTPETVRRAWQKTSRMVMNSGGLEYVSDQGFGKHSVFSYFLLDRLEQNTQKYILASELFSRIKDGVIYNAKQTPLYGALLDTGAELGGEMVFVLDKKYRNNAIDENEKRAINELNSKIETTNEKMETNPSEEYDNYLINLLNMEKKLYGLKKKLLINNTDNVVFLENKASQITPNNDVFKANLASVIIESEPNDANVYLNDTLYGNTPCQILQLQAGQTVQLKLKKQNYHPKTLDIQLKDGINDLKKVLLKPMFGKLIVNSEPSNAEVFIAGKHVGHTPYTNKMILSGAYLLSVKKKFYLTIKKQTIKIYDETTTKKHFELKPNYGILEVHSEPDASVFLYNINGNQLSNSNTPCEIKALPGKIKVKLLKKGYEDLIFDTTIVVNHTTVIKKSNAVLRRLEGQLTVTTDPFKRGTEVFINEVKKGEVPLIVNLPIGEYKIEARYKNKHEFINMSGTKKVYVKDRDQLMIKIEFNETKFMKIICGKKNITYKEGKLYCIKCPGITDIDWDGGCVSGGTTPIIFGNFTAPDNNEVIVDFYGCGGGVSNFGGFFLLREINNNWSIIRYEEGTRPANCLKVLNNMNRNILICQNYYPHQGDPIETLRYLEIGNSETKNLYLLTIKSDLAHDCCCEKHIENFELKDANQDNIPDLFVTVSEIKAKKKRYCAN